MVTLFSSSSTGHALSWLGLRGLEPVYTQIMGMDWEYQSILGHNGYLDHRGSLA